MHICIHKLTFVHTYSTCTINWNSKLSILTWLLDSSLFWVVLGGEPLLRRIPRWIVHFWKTLKNECKSMDNIQWLILPMYLVTMGIMFHKSESMRFLSISTFNVGSLLKYTSLSKCLWKVNRKCHPWNHIKEIPTVSEVVIMKCVLMLENVASNGCSQIMENPRILLSVFLKTEWASLSMNGRITFHQHDFLCKIQEFSLKGRNHIINNEVGHSVWLPTISKELQICNISPISRITKQSSWFSGQNILCDKSVPLAIYAFITYIHIL